MSEMRNVALEFLRHGPPHNQLLSPLTAYLALCGNHPSATARVPYEHAQFLARHEALVYEKERRVGLSPASRKEARCSRELQLQITAQEMSEVFASVPGLIAELKRSKEHPFSHFEIVTSAAELALLPFELADAPNGCPGAGQPLTLQSEAPLCMTRRVRRVDNEPFEWPHRPRILFAFNLPAHDAEALVPAHTLALRRAIDPWVGRHRHDRDDSDAPPTWVGKYLTVMERASARSIADELGKGNYTHLHLLAHGKEVQEGVDRRFALELHNPDDASRGDKVTASRLATLVRTLACNGSCELAVPSVITLASCNGANGGSVVGAGSSIAHALHEAGIPLVVSSQFPLSFRGSVKMVETLYEGLLWGEDPRYLISDLRRRLKSELSDTHDWASLVTYAALPLNIDEQLRQMTYHQIFRCIEAAFSYSDWEAHKKSPPVADGTKKDGTGPSTNADSTSRAPAPDENGSGVELNRRLATAKSKLKELLRSLQDGEGDAKSERLALIYGRLASTTKREAEFQFGQHGNAPRHPPSTPAFDWKDTLRQAQKYYRKAFEIDRAGSWAIVQDVSISAVLDREKMNRFEDWNLAWILSERDRQHETRENRAYAISNLMELRLMSLWFPMEAARMRKLAVKSSRGKIAGWYQIVIEDLRELADELEENVRETDWEIVSRRRQLNRYLHWFFHDDGEPMDDFAGAESFEADTPRLIKGLCQMLLDRLPEHDPGSMRD